MTRARHVLGWTACSLGLSLSAGAQAFVIDDSKVPLHNSPSQDIEFGDVDLDGDWDVVIGNGEEYSNWQSELWINQGGLQGAEKGLFLDEGATRLPQDDRMTYDSSLGDIDEDGDLDLHLSNAWIGLNRWWVNAGGKQAGSLGYFVDETASRWIGLGEPGSSIPLVYVGDGSFIDDGRDSELADLDNDGDLDLIHVTYLGGANTPARLFLNDGDGHFQEFNPTGVVATGLGLMPGDPGVWCEGLYDNLTADTTGAFCDPTTNSWDADAGDLDGDFDLDLVFADDFRDPGVFANRLEGSSLAPAAGGALAFRDVSGAVLEQEPGFGGNDGNCQELGDLDGDGDLDLVGADYTVVPYSRDGVFENVGGAFVLRSVYPNIADKTSVDLLDYDNDGDLDYLTAEWVLELHANQGGFNFVDVPLPSLPKSNHDADAADVDGDGDLDLIVAMQGGTGEHLFVNQSAVPDTWAPYLPSVEELADRTSAPGLVPVRAHVYDNAPHYITAHNPTRVEVAVDGMALPSIHAQGSGAQVFRAVVPANLAGQVTYRFVSQDESGNAGASAALAYASTPPAPFQAAYGVATAGLAGGAPLLRALSVPFAGSTLFLALSSAAAGAPAVIGIGSQRLDPGVLLPGLLFLQVTGHVYGVAPLTLDGGGDAVLPAHVGTVPAGLTVYAQGFVLDATAAGELFASSKGLAVTTQ